MAPTPVPDPAFRTDVAANHIRLRPTGTDDWDNIQDALNDLSGLADATLELSGGTFYTRYMLEQSDPRIKWRANGSSTVLVFGLASSRIQFLDDADRRRGFAPGGWPFGLLVHPSAGGGTVQLDMKGFTMQAGADGVKGYDGALFGLDIINMHVQQIVAVMASSVSVGVMDELSPALTGTGPHPLLSGNTNLSTDQDLGVSMWGFEFQDNAGTEYVEGVDFSINTTTGEISRIGTGAIGDGQQIFLTYNLATPAGNDPSLFDVKMEDMTFRTSPQKDGEFTYMGCDIALKFTGAMGVRVVGSQGAISFAGVITEQPAGATLRTDLIPAAVLTELWNGTVDIRGCTFQNVSATHQVLHAHGVPAVDGGIDFSAARARARVTYAGNQEIDAHSGVLNFASALGHCQGIDYYNRDNEIFGKNSGYLRTFWWNGFSEFTVPGAFRAADVSQSITGNHFRGWQVIPDQFGGFQLQWYENRDFGNPATNPASMKSSVLDDNIVELVGQGTFRNVVDLNDLDRCAVTNNTLVSMSEAKAPTPFRVRSGSATVGDNDTSQYQLQDGAVHLQIDAGASNVHAQLEDTELFSDGGSTTPSVSGGTLVP